MKQIRIVILTFLFAAGCAGVASHSTHNPSLYGEWLCISATIDGKTLPLETTKALRLTVTKARYITVKGDETLFDSTYRIDRTKHPAQIYMLGNEGALIGKEAQGIYELQGDTLRICYTMPGDSPPTAFQSAPGSKASLVIWRRAQ